MRREGVSKVQCPHNDQKLALLNLAAFCPFSKLTVRAVRGVPAAIAHLPPPKIVVIVRASMHMCGFYAHDCLWRTTHAISIYCVMKFYF